MPVINANSADPDQMQHSAASDLGQHCSPVSHLWDARHKWVKVIEYAPMDSKVFPLRVDPFSEGA